MSSELRLLQISDPHLFGSAEGALRGVPTRRSLEAVLRHARAHHWNAEAILLTGDLVNDEPERLRRGARAAGRSGQARLVPAGQSRRSERSCAAQLAAPPFSVGGHHDLGAWRVVMLDSCVPGQVLRSARAARNWHASTRALASAGERQVLIGLHHHPAADGQPLDRYGGTEERRGVVCHHRSLRVRARHRLGPRAPEPRFAAQGRAAPGHALDLRAVPAAFGALRDRSRPARLPAIDCCAPMAPSTPKWCAWRSMRARDPLSGRPAADAKLEPG